MSAEAKALLDRAEAAAQAGDAGLARTLLNQIITEYPSSGEAIAAQKALVTEPERRTAQAVRVVDLDIAFGSMVWLFVKAAFAAIPAVMIIAMILVFVLGSVGGALSGFR